MYIHGFIDGVLAVIVLGMVALIAVAVIYSRKKEVAAGWSGRRQYPLSVSCTTALVLLKMVQLMPGNV